MKTFCKGENVVGVHDKFVYHIETYLMWKNGGAIYDDTYYSVSKPLKFKKKDNLLKKKDYKFVRFIDLEFAPQNYLESNGYTEIT